MKWFEVLASGFRKEPIATFAIVITLVPFVYDVVKNDLLKRDEFTISCEAVDPTDYSHERGFLFYTSKCLFSNRSSDSVSVEQVYPVVLNGEYPFRLTAEEDFIPELPDWERTIASRRLRELNARFPVFVHPRETVGFVGLFAYPIGDAAIVGAAPVQCKDSHGKVDASALAFCFDGVPDEEEGRLVAAKTRIYTGVAFGRQHVNNFGLQLDLSSGKSLVIEADTTEFWTQCSDIDRHLNCGSGWTPDFDEVRTWDLDEGASTVTGFWYRVLWSSAVVLLIFSGYSLISGLMGILRGKLSKK